MIGKTILLVIFCMGAGMASSAGVFALVLMLGIFRRMIAFSNTGSKIMWHENAAILGGITGCMLSFDSTFGFCVHHGILGNVILAVIALGFGIFVGCEAVALAEVLNIFPILYRRVGIKSGLSYVMIAMALGKVVGSICYYLGGFVI